MNSGSECRHCLGSTSQWPDSDLWKCLSILFNLRKHCGKKTKVAAKNGVTTPCSRFHVKLSRFQFQMSFLSSCSPKHCEMILTYSNLGSLHASVSSRPSLAFEATQSLGWVQGYFEHLHPSRLPHVFNQVGPVVSVPTPHAPNGAEAPSCTFKP